MTAGLVIIVRPNEKVTILTVKKPPSLRRLQKMVGGYIEIVPEFDRFAVGTGSAPAVAICNEEGKITGLPFNPLATAMWYKSVDGPVTDTLVGNVIILTGSKQYLQEWGDT